MKTLQRTLFIAFALAFCHTGNSADPNFKGGLALDSPPSVGAAYGVWVDGKFYNVEQVGGLRVALIEGRPYKPGPAGETVLTGMAELKAAATEGDATAERILAVFHWEGRQNLSKDVVEAYKWAALAALQGDKPSTALVRELTLFMKPDDLPRARQAVMDHLKRKLEQL